MNAIRSRNGPAPDDFWCEGLPLWNATETKGDEHADVGFYLRLIARSQRPVVELGVGYGRVARWTRPEYGVDESVRMLRRCAPLVPGMRPVAARVHEYWLPERAAFTYAPQNLMSLVGGPEQTLEALAAVHRNTRRGGRFAFDVAVPDWDRITSRLDQPLVKGQVGSARVGYRAELVSVDPKGGHGAFRMHHFVDQLDEDGEVLTRVRYRPVAIDYYCPRRWREMLTRTNWRVQRCWGGFAGEPLTGASRRQAWLVSR
ncbi:MAG TPA: hypothetical protein VFM37_09050 [Pseudonocardiaceae bacterium]|nr:hypothetical protein [Pseudonocardiaceae bacterium]